MLPEGYTFIYDYETNDAYIWSNKSMKPMSKHIKGNEKKPPHPEIISGVCENKKHKSYSIHRLIAHYFIPNPNNLPEVDHINRDSTDNRIENLRWASKGLNLANRGRGYRLKKGKWEVYCVYKGKNYSGGTFLTEDEAIESRLKLFNKLYSDELLV